MLAHHLAAQHASEAVAIESDTEWSDISAQTSNTAEVSGVNELELPQLRVVVLECCAVEEDDVVPNSSALTAQLREQCQLLHRGSQVSITTIGGHEVTATVVVAELFPSPGMCPDGQGRVVLSTRVVVVAPRRWLVCDELGRALREEPGFSNVGRFISRRVSGQGSVACVVNAGDSGELCGDFIRRFADTINVACLSFTRFQVSTSASDHFQFGGSPSVERLFSTLVTLSDIPLVVIVHGWDHKSRVEEIDSDDDSELVVIRDADGTPVLADVQDKPPPGRAQELSILTKLCLSHCRHRKVAIVVMSTGTNPDLIAAVDGPLVNLSAVSPALATVVLHDLATLGIPVEVAVPHLRGSLYRTLEVCGELAAAAAAEAFATTEAPVLDHNWVANFFAQHRGQVPQQFDEVVDVLPTWDTIVDQIVMDTTSTGFCVCGPSGSGKSSCLSAIAEAPGFASISLNIHNSVHGYVGDSAASIRQALDAAIAARPAVIVVDDADHWLGAHGTVEQEIVGQLLAALESTLVPGQIIIVVTATHIDDLPQALRRRLNVIEIPPPTIDEAVAVAEVCGLEHTAARSWIDSLSWVPHRGDLAFAAVAH
mmetsp:Transcript_71092/g.189580  ORF Transcript_71092/g.189580 Transcript_71092/m.189580 type:complete len:597 (+) Transcript_71092:2333-4123(+)